MIDVHKRVTRLRVPQLRKAVNRWKSRGYRVECRWDKVWSGGVSRYDLHFRVEAR